ncbi:MAG: type II toxin-antitoxin system RelE/ParE family toxin [Cyclobacteriaceae bacterium]|nr:type II toxin-antitoxin system RelE/ParE family toxin [Cyclobacteriaceae bacterium]
MNFNVIATGPFERKLKKLAKKHKSLKADLSVIIDQLTISPDLGTPLGKDCYKIRLAISSKGKGKSGGARLITYVRIVREIVYLMDIYDKSDQSSITDKELKLLIDLLADE